MRTELQKQNLQKVIDGLKKHKNVLNLKMSNFTTSSYEAATATPEHICETNCCIVGYAPSFGVPIGDQHVDISQINKVAIVEWTDYSIESFGFQAYENDYSDWSFCFHDYWSNDVDEAIARLELAQKDEIPEEWGYDDKFAEEK